MYVWQIQIPGYEESMLRGRLAQSDREMIECLSPDMACNQASNYVWYWDLYNPIRAVDSLLADFIYIYIYYCMCWYIYIYLLLISSQGLMSINFSRFWLGWKLSSPISDGTPAKLQAPVEEQLKVKVDKDDDDGVVDQVLCQSQSQGCLGFWCDQLSSKVKYVTRIPQTPHLRHYLALFRFMILHHHHHRHLQNRHPRRKLPERNWNHSRWRRNCLRSLADLATNWCSCPSQYQGRINEAVEAIKVRLFHSTCELWFVKVGAKTTLNSQHIYKSSIWMV